MKIAIVTGVSWKTGIGFAITKRLLKDGFFVYALYHSENACQQILTEEEQSRCQFLQINLESRESIEALAQSLRNVKVDVLVNNAGAFPEEDFENYDFKEWDRTIAVNLTAPFLMSMLFKENFCKDAVIINMASTDGFKGSFSSIAYAASKAALMNLTQSLAINFGYSDKKIRVVAVAPGWVKTFDPTDPENVMVPPSSIKIAPQITPLERFAEPDEIADLVIFLVSEQAKFITGNTILIDGGYNTVSIDMLRESGRKFHDYIEE